MYWIWSAQVSFSSTITPRNFVLRSCCMHSPLISRFSQISGWRMPWDRKKIWRVFDTLGESLLQSNQSTILVSSMFIILISSSALFPDKNTLVSSANSIGNSTLDTEAMSLIYNKNGNGPKIEPCGTPHVIVFWDDLTSSYETYWDRHDK